MGVELYHLLILLSGWYEKSELCMGIGVGGSFALP